MIGISGNVAVHRDTVLQHDNMVSDRRRARVLTAAAPDFVKSGQRDVAIELLRRAVEWDPDDVRAVRRLTWYLRQDAQPEEGEGVLRAYLERHPQSGEVRQALFEHALRDRRLSDARAEMEQMLDHPKARWRDLARSLQFDLSARGTCGGARHTPRPADSAVVDEGAIARQLRRRAESLHRREGHRRAAPPVTRQKGMLAIGSTIKFARAGTAVWGTGTPRMTDALSPEAEYWAVRGPLTRELVQRSGGSAPTVFGDPACCCHTSTRPPGYHQAARRRADSSSQSLSSAHRASGRHGDLAGALRLRGHRAVRRRGARVRSDPGELAARDHHRARLRHPGTLVRLQRRAERAGRRRHQV